MLYKILSQNDPIVRAICRPVVFYLGPGKWPWNPGLLNLETDLRGPSILIRRFTIDKFKVESPQCIDRKKPVLGGVSRRLPFLHRLVAEDTIGWTNRVRHGLACCVKCVVL